MNLTAPGDILVWEFMLELGMSIDTLSHHLQIPRDETIKVMESNRAIDDYLARRLSITFGTTKQFWINLQIRYDQLTAVQGAAS